MEQADFSLEIGWWIEIEEAAHDTFNCNSNRSLFKLCCTRCLNLKHVLTFVHDEIGTFKASDILWASSSYSPAKKISCAKLLAWLKKLRLYSFDSHLTRCLSGRQQTDGQCGFRITLVENQRAWRCSESHWWGNQIFKWISLSRKTKLPDLNLDTSDKVPHIRTMLHSSDR